MTRQKQIEQMRTLLQQLPVPNGDPFADLVAKLEQVERSAERVRVRC